MPPPRPTPTRDRPFPSLLPDDPIPAMPEHPLTAILQAAADGDPGAAERLVPAVYDQLRAMARRQLHGDAATLDPTALVHEAWLRLGPADAAGWRHRGHFFGAAAQAMRRILVDAARARLRHKRRAPDRPRTSLRAADAIPAGDHDPAELLDVDAALQRLERERPREARIVSLRYFGGLSNDEVAAALEVSVGTVERDWRLARARLQRWLDQPAG